MSNGNPVQKAVLLAGIIAAGLLAAAFSTNQLIPSSLVQDATAQQQQVRSGNQTGGWTGNNNMTKMSTLSTSGMASTQVQPDKFMVTAGVTTNSTSARDAVSANARLMGNLTAALEDLGVPREQMGTSSYNLYPVYKAKTPEGVDSRMCEIYPLPPECQPGQEIAGYRVTNTLSVTLDVNGTISAGEVIDAAVGAGANEVNGVLFFISDERQQQIRDTLVGEAIANARHRADIAAGALGTSITGVQSVTVNDLQFPIFSRGLGLAESAAGGTQLLPGQQQVSANVSITFYIDDTMSPPPSSSSSSPSAGGGTR